MRDSVRASAGWGRALGLVMLTGCRSDPGRPAPAPSATVAALPTAPTPTPSVTRFCYLMDCMDSLSLGFSGRLVTPGSYRILVTVDGVRTLCLATLSMDGSIHHAPQVRPECDAVFSFIDPLRTPGDTYFAHRRELEVQVTRNGTPVAHSHSVYEVDRPNGPNCEGACRRTTVTVVVEKG
jgi:hypothetical protein